MSTQGRSMTTGAGKNHIERRKKGSSLQRHDEAANGTVHEDRVEHERAMWVQQRQTELDGVLNAHDTLVREHFHLEKFLTLTSYHPEAAKEDKSAVFQEYKSHYDLVHQSTAAGPSRQTRRAQTERMQMLKGSAAVPSTSRPKRGSGADVTGGSAHVGPTVVHAKGKAPMVFHDTHGKHDTVYTRKGKAKAKPADDVEVSMKSNARPSKRVGGDILSEAESPQKKRRLMPVSLSTIIQRQPPSQLVSATLSKRPLARKQEPQLSFSAASAPLSNLHLPPSKSSVKRVRLIVRPPEPVYTNPRQKPIPPRYGESLTAFLSSYIVLDDKEVDDPTVAQLVLKNAAFWDRVDSLRKQGRFFPAGLGDDPLAAYNPQDASSSHISQDPWAHVVEAVKARTLFRSVTGRQVAAQVASRVCAYWESRAVKEDKVKLQEEKRLRALAKAMVKMVVAEWKKAVYHVREEERLKREEEERRRGHEHLDAILDQSGQILEAQQMELSKATSRSRSSSVSVVLGHWTSSSPGPNEPCTSASDDKQRVEEQEEASDSDDAEGLDSSFLLGLGDNVSYLNRTSRSGSTEASTILSISEAQSQDDPGRADNEELEKQSVYATGSREHLNATPARTASSSPSLHPADSFRIVGSEEQEESFQELEDQAHTTITVTPSTSPELSGSSYLFAATNGNRRIISKDFLDVGEIHDGDIEPRAVTKLTNGSAKFHVQQDASSPAPPLACMQEEIKSKQETAHSPAPASSTIMVHDPSQTTSIAGRSPPDDAAESDVEEDSSIPLYLRPYAVAPVEWDPKSKVKAPFLLRGTLRPYQQAGLEWLASLHANNLNGILADEMGLGKTIQTISLLAHLACDRGIWGPHLIIVPTSVLLNWEMEFKKFLPGFKVLSYHGNTKRRKELRQGWNNKYHFNVCVTSYTLASRDAHVFKRKPWYYMILDEAHMIKNFKSQRWNILLMFRSFRRLLLTGTPLQNNLTELWALLQFLMSGTNFANLKEFGDWFSNPLEKAIEMGIMDDETQQRVSKLHMVLRPYLLRRLKRDVEKELPHKYEHLVMCPLSKRQRFLYDEFMARAETRHDLRSGVYQKIANILMQLRKVVNHPDLFEVRPIVTSFAMERSAIADFEIKEFLVRRQLLGSDDETRLNLGVLGLQFVDQQDTSIISALETRHLDGTSYLPMITELPGEPPPHDTRSIEGYKQFRAWQQRASTIAKWTHIGYLNRLRCAHLPLYSRELLTAARRLYRPLQPVSYLARQPWDTVEKVYAAVKSYADRGEDMADIIDKFALITPAVVARDLPALALSGCEAAILATQRCADFDTILHRASVKLQIAFPDPLLLQYDCGKLQELARLLRERKAGGHRVLIFTQMTRILDILEIFLNFHGYLYLRLDGATKIEDRQYITERFNSDPRIFCFISSSRSGGVGINLTGADTVIFYDSDFNPQMDRQCEDRAHRIGQIRDVHIYRFVSQHTVEEALLRKANQKRSLDDIVIQKGEFDWRSLFSDETALTKALGDFEDSEDAHAAVVAASEEVAMEGADEADFSWDGGGDGASVTIHSEEPEQKGTEVSNSSRQVGTLTPDEEEELQGAEDEEEEAEGGTTVDYMLATVRSDMDFLAIGVCDMYLWL